MYIVKSIRFLYNLWKSFFYDKKNRSVFILFTLIVFLSPLLIQTFHIISVHLTHDHKHFSGYNYHKHGTEQGGTNPFLLVEKHHKCPICEFSYYVFSIKHTSDQSDIFSFITELILLQIKKPDFHTFIFSYFLRAPPFSF